MVIINLRERKMIYLLANPNLYMKSRLQIKTKLKYDKQIQIRMTKICCVRKWTWLVFIDKQRAGIFVWRFLSSLKIRILLMRILLFVSQFLFFYQRKIVSNEKMYIPILYIFIFYSVLTHNKEQRRCAKLWSRHPKKSRPNFIIPMISVHLWLFLIGLF
jgi:hypothetical protein